MAEPKTDPDPLLGDVMATCRSQKRLAERAIAQLSDDQLHLALDENTNCIVVIMKHLAGNMTSRWTDFLTTDGEKPSRNRDGEFVDDVRSRDELMAIWEAGWVRLFDALGSLGGTDLDKQVKLRGEPQTARQAILGQLSHYGYHVGQIVLIAAHLAKDRWEWLTIPPGQSEAYNKRVWKR